MHKDLKTILITEDEIKAAAKRLAAALTVLTPMTGLPGAGFLLLRKRL